MNTEVKSTISIRFIEAIEDTHDVDAAERQRWVDSACRDCSFLADPRRWSPASLGLERMLTPGHYRAQHLSPISSLQ